MEPLQIMALLAMERVVHLPTFLPPAALLAVFLSAPVLAEGALPVEAAGVGEAVVVVEMEVVAVQLPHMDLPPLAVF
jgi:hypothetical protein